MDSVEKVPCSICLESERNTNLLVDFWKKQCYFQIIDEIRTNPPPSPPIWLCYECEALLSRFTRFKIRVKNAFQVLQNFDLQDAPPKSSTLTTNNIFNFSIDPNDKTENSCEVIPTIIKTEPTEFPDNTSLASDDDKFLIEYKSKKKRKGKKKKKVVDEILEVDLSREEIEEERRQMELRDDYVNAMFRCETCIVTFPNEHDLNDHKNLKHLLNANKITCKICSSTFATLVSYKTHSVRHTRRYQCGECGMRYTSRRGARRHRGGAHCYGTEQPFETEVEPKTQNGETERGDGEKQDDAAQQSFPCSQCNKTFRWKTSLRKHNETHRIETGLKRRPYCEPCRLSFSTTSNLQKHVKTSSKHQIQLKLRKLNSTLPEDLSPEKHQAHIDEIKTSVTSSRQMFPCTQCDKRFQWRGNLLRHQDSHAARAKGELKCIPCDRTFSSIATYKQHMSISKKHVTENDFKYMCSDCGKRFANKTRLKDHVDWEHLKHYAHRCAHCGKVFRSRTSLYLHQAAHRAAAARLCHHCGKGFPSHAKLRTHIQAIHSRSAPYSCTRCGARFSWHSCLSRHLRRVHARDREGGDRQGDKGGDRETER